MDFTLTHALLLTMADICRLLAQFAETPTGIGLAEMTAERFDMMAAMVDP